MRASIQALTRFPPDEAADHVPQPLHAYSQCGASHPGCPSYGICDEDSGSHPTYHHCASCAKHWIK